MNTTVIETKRFLLKELTEKDATHKYLGWLNDPRTHRFIVTANVTKELEDLKKYISQRLNDPSCLFFGIFLKDSGEHIGNVKYEPIDLNNKIATMGIMIGERDWRGKGVAGEAILASANYLKKAMGISKILLGVESENKPAINAYQKMGFKRLKGHSLNGFYMKLAI